MYLAGSFDEVLKVSPGEKVAQINELAVVFVFDVDYAPAIQAASNLLSVDNDWLLAANNGKGDHVLTPLAQNRCVFLSLEIWNTLICAFMARSSSSSSPLSYGYIFRLWKLNSSLILSLKASRSSRVNESDFAITGTTFTTSESFLRTTISIGFKLSWKSVIGHR